MRGEEVGDENSATLAEQTKQAGCLFSASGKMPDLRFAI
jgi:hypothetical protein